MNTVAIIGAGKLGTSLGMALKQKGFKIQSLSCRTLSSAQESRQIIGQGKAVTDNIQAVDKSQIIFLTVPDDITKQIAFELASGRKDWENKYVFLCSGLLAANVMESLQTLGAYTGSLHPIQSFATKSSNPDIFTNVYFGVEGSSPAVEMAKTIIQKLKGYPILLKSEDKPLYHAACSLASNSFVSLIGIAASLLKHLGIKEDQIIPVLYPLIQGTLQNVNKFNIPKALTGPINRGDLETIKTHLQALKMFPHYRDVYLTLAKTILEIVKKEQNLAADKIRALEELLEDK